MQTVSNILITGASTGIGLGLATELVKRGHRVFATVRKAEDAIQLTNNYSNNIIPILMDVTDETSVKRAFIEIKQMLNKQGLVALINNAGIAIGGPLQHQSMDEITQHFEVNVIGLIRTTQAFLPLLGAFKNCPFPAGRIINISSVGGQIAAPFVGAYVGTKHAVEGISHSLRRELLIYGIDVIIVGPGAVKTPIWDKGIRLEKYKDTDYWPILKGFGKAAKKGGEEGLSTEYLGTKIADIIESRHPKVRYAYAPQKWKNWTLPRLLPHRLVDYFLKRQFGIS